MAIATLSQVGDFAKITYCDPLKYVTALTGYTFDYSGIGNFQLEFRWSTTNLIKTAWILLTEANLQAIVLDPNKELWLDFRVTLLAGGPLTINNLTVSYDQDPIAQDKFLGFVPVNTTCECGNISSLVKFENFTFKPYAVNPAVNMYRSLSYTINQLFGHTVEYARATPLMNGRDVTLKEWTLYDVENPCTIKVVVPNNEFPDNKINFGPMGLDFEMPFEIHITKEYFEDLFGVGTAPQKRDIVYFPLTNRIYEVQSSYLFRDFMQKPVYWKVALMKYAPKPNRVEPTELRNFLDEISADTDELFSEVLIDDELKKTKPQQYDPKIGSKDYDPTREYIDDSLLIVQENLLNYYTVVATGHYDLRTVYKANELSSAVVYRSKVEFSDTDNRAFTAWFKDSIPKLVSPRDQVQGSFTTISVSATQALVQFSIPAIRSYSVGDLLKFSRPNGIVFYGEVASQPAPNTYRVNVPTQVYNFLQAQHSGWQTVGNFTTEPTQEKFLLWGYDPVSSVGWKFSLLVGRYMKLYLNGSVEYFVLPQNLGINEWYAVFLNVSNEYSQISLNVWKRRWVENDPNTVNTTDLENIYTIARQITPADYTVTSTDWDKYRLIGTPIALTNVRLFDSIENDLQKQIILLNQNIVDDSQLSIIVDNAIQRLKLPWIGKTK
jgi:hypothetical protein